MRYFVATIFSCLFFAGPAEAKNPPLFENSVASILKDHCVKCHGQSTRKGELDLSSPKGIARGGESGPVYQAGDPSHSHLLELIVRGAMPKKGPKLTAPQIGTIRQWITAGAHFQNPPPTPEKDTPTQHDVLPIVLLRCAACHGRQLKENQLDLRSLAAMTKGGAAGPALVPGDPDSSLMIQRIESHACPPRDKLLKFFVKRPPKSEVRALREWIAAGAPEGNERPDVATTSPDPLVNEEDRNHWAFQPPIRPSSGDSVDFFIERKLSAAGLSFSPEADRDPLIRRAYIDLTGMPPSVPDWKKWKNAAQPDWFARMIDHLLDSPHYGERWGRYWLDLAGYADSEGGLSSDPIRQVAWKYRDYVIRSFQNDKPYDRFLLEQIAGDELIDHENTKPVTEGLIENLIATGFLRMGIDQTGSRTMNFAADRVGVIADAISVIGSGVMGLTLDCVRCHSHKYDPIPQRDYYRMKAIFQGALDEHDWLSFKTRELRVATPQHRAKVARSNPPLESEIKKLEASRKKKVADWHRRLLISHYPDQSESDRERTFTALRRADNTRTQEQRILVEKLQRVLAMPEETQPAPVQNARSAIAEIDRQIVSTRSKLEPPLAIRALWDRGEPSPTYLLRRGEITSPDRPVGPGIPSVLTDGKTPFRVSPPFPDGRKSTGRRLAFARWLTRPENPLTARVLVNRVWRHHFGEGLVATLENFGVQGEKPTHPELLDWLAVEFANRGWSIKELHRMILNSKTYRQSSRISEAALAGDPNNRLLSRMPMQRLDAEALRDSLLFVSGKLDPTPGGPPDPVEIGRDGSVSALRTARGGWRRSIYMQYRRTEIPTMMNTFDYPEMGPNCVIRPISTVSPQSLFLLNNDRIRELAGALAESLRNLAPEKSIRSVYQAALSRDPSSEELRGGTGALRDLESAWNGDSRKALESFCHAIFNSAEFIYVD